MLQGAESMQADIGWICVADHAGEQLQLHAGPTVTVSAEERWAYCRIGATSRHVWRARESLDGDDVRRFGPPTREASEEAEDAAL